MAFLGPRTLGGRLLDFSPLRTPQKGSFAKSQGPKGQWPFPCQPGHSEVSGGTGKLGVWLSRLPAFLSHPKIAEVLSPLGRAVLQRIRVLELGALGSHKIPFSC